MKNYKLMTVLSLAMLLLLLTGACQGLPQTVTVVETVEVEKVVEKEVVIEKEVEGGPPAPKVLPEEITEAAKERLEETREKSPFVAEVIEGICPVSTEEDVDEAYEKDLALTRELLVSSQIPPVQPEDDDDGVTEVDPVFATYDEEEIRANKSVEGDTGEPFQ